MCASIYKIYKELAVPLPLSTMCNLKNLFYIRYTHMQFLQHTASYKVVDRPFSSSAAGDERNQLFMTSYLMRTFGFSAPRATAIVTNLANHLKFDGREKPDSVISFFRNHGFSALQISKVINNRPVILFRNPEEIVLPKLEFFYSLGFSKEDTAEICSKRPVIMFYTSENVILPLYRLMKDVLQSDKKVISTLKRCNWGLNFCCTKYLEENIKLLKEVGVPEKNIAFLLTTYSRTLFMKKEMFFELVDEVKKHGFDVSLSQFVLAINALSKYYDSTRQRCFQVFGEWGWSSDHIQAAFRKFPLCLTISAEKLRKTLEFLINKMGYQAEDIAKRPGLLLYSLQNRIIPRCSVIRGHSLMGLTSTEVRPWSVMAIDEKTFLKKFVHKHPERVRQLLDIYKGRIDVFESDSAKLLKICRAEASNLDSQ